MSQAIRYLVAGFFLGSFPLYFCATEQPACSSLLESAKKGDLTRVLELIDKGVNVNCHGAYGYTPLLIAARHSRLDVVEALFNKGAAINTDSDIDMQQQEWGYTPLLWAVNNSFVDLAEFLLDNGAKLGTQGRGGEIPLIIAARKNCLPLVELLVAKGASIDATNAERGQTALEEAVAGGYLDIVDFLVQKGADLKRRDFVGGSLLSAAVGRGHSAMVRYLHEKGLSVNSTDNSGLTPIFLALDGRIESRYIAEYLIEHGADVSVKSADGTTPLMVASHHGSKEAIEMLIAKGVDVKAKNVFGETALQSACQGIGYDLTEDPMKREAVISLLIDNGAEVSTRDRDGRTPLIEASSRGGSKIVGILLAQGALPNTQDRIGRTALMYAAESNHIETIKLLVKQGADLNLKDSKGRTALTIAKQRKQSLEAYELLRSLGAKNE
jgi:ankyrin repeat protein